MRKRSQQLFKATSFKKMEAAKETWVTASTAREPVKNFYGGGRKAR